MSTDNMYYTVPTYNTLQINEKGNVRKTTGGSGLISGVEYLKPYISKDGEVLVTFTSYNKKITVSVAKLLALTFLTKKSKENTVKYLDNNPSNLSIGNLYWSNGRAIVKPMKNWANKHRTINIEDRLNKKLMPFKNLHEAAGYLKVSIPKLISLVKLTETNPYKSRYRVEVPLGVVTSFKEEEDKIMVFDHTSGSYRLAGNKMIASLKTGVEHKVISNGLLNNELFYYGGFTFTRGKLPVEYFDKESPVNIEKKSKALIDRKELRNSVESDPNIKRDESKVIEIYNYGTREVREYIDSQALAFALKINHRLVELAIGRCKKTNSSQFLNRNGIRLKSANTPWADENIFRMNLSTITAKDIPATYRIIYANGAREDVTGTPRAYSKTRLPFRKLLKANMPINTVYKFNCYGKRGEIFRVG